MKLLIFDKYTLIAASLAVFVGAALFSGAAQDSGETYASAGRELPIYSVATDKREVALTFDTAWGNEDIDSIIELLRQAQCPATFFLTGEWIDKFPEDVKKLHEAGHEVANHSLSHAHFNSLSESEMLADIEACDEKLLSITGEKNVLFRAPYGEYNEALVGVCKGSNRYIIQWSLDSLDYKGLSTAEMKQRLLPKLREGDILLFHTGTDNTAAALPEIIGEIKQMGYSFKTVGELIYKENFSIDHEGRQHTN